MESQVLNEPVVSISMDSADTSTTTTVNVLFGSQTGNAEGVASQFAGVARAMG